MKSWVLRNWKGYKNLKFEVVNKLVIIEILSLESWIEKGRILYM